MGKSDAAFSQKYWFDLALFYCSKRETSRPKLKAYLVRKIREYKIEEIHQEKVINFIETTLDECQRLKIIDHDRYAQMLDREFKRRGKGKRYIAQKLKEKGIEEEFKNLDHPEDEELARAREFLEKTKNRASFQRISDQRILKQKLLQRLIGQGFDFTVAKKALEKQGDR